MKHRSRIFLYFRILSMGFLLMVCFFNCGQPGELRLKGEASAVAPDSANTVAHTDDQAPGSDVPSAPASNPNPPAPPGINQVINEMKPALAVRATGCIMCHAQIGSSVITDFGLGGDGKGKDYFFGGPPSSLTGGLSNTRGKAIYGDYDTTTGTSDRNWSQAILDEHVSVIVPQASTKNLRLPDGKPLPADESTLAKYIRKQLDFSNDSKKSNVQEVKTVYIGAPNKAKIISISQVGTGAMNYKPSKAADVLVGLGKSEDGKYYTNKATINCDGDVAIDGILYLDQPKLITQNG